MYIGAQQTYSQYLISFIITVLTNDIFHAMFAKMGFKASFILMYIGAQQTYSQYLISFIITVLTNDIFHAMFAKMGFKVRPIMKIYI